MDGNEGDEIGEYEDGFNGVEMKERRRKLGGEVKLKMVSRVAGPRLCRRKERAVGAAKGGKERLERATRQMADAPTKWRNTIEIYKMKYLDLKIYLLALTLSFCT
jgi:hypothetical protein